ncbi:twin-arginine translocase subunit TatC [Methylobacillus flagellatus]|uniref:twin-arginine translocase subunit TatC n=1 Tax=Methylobacillus flagellatus TaxID=405 RepID=UPI0010F7B51A|nr:twin-arginine translocase subunit TatC [Methylobacillus flagellatus]
MSVTNTFISHLLELRDRLLRTLLVFVAVFICLFPFANDIYTLLAQPMLAKLPAGGQMIATAVTTPFFVPMKVAMMAAFLLTLPHTLYQIWSFVSPGLYAHERKLMAPLVFASTLLFVLGMAFAYFLVLPVVFGFITGITPQGVAVMTDIGNYLDFILGLFMAFGLAFEVPVAVVMIVLFGWVEIASLKEARGYVVVGAFVLGAIFTPPDVLSQIMLAIPLWLLYELGIIIAGVLKRQRDASPRLPDQLG